MGNSTWQDEIIIQAKKWPRRFRARFDRGVWHLLGANQDVQEEFKVCAQRIHRELSLPQGDVSPVDALLYRLKEEGHHVRLWQRLKKYRTGSVHIDSNVAHATIDPLRAALIRFISHGPGANPSARARSQAPARNSWQSGAHQRNRERQARASIIRALRSLGGAYDTKWPDFVREFYTNPQEHTEYQQPISPPIFQAPAFDRLNQTPKDWAKAADAAWQRHRDSFLQRCEVGVAAGMDEKIPAAKRNRGTGKAQSQRKRSNTAIECRYEWAAMRVCGEPWKEIAARYKGKESAVIKAASEVLRVARWPTKPKKQT